MMFKTAVASLLISVLCACSQRVGAAGPAAASPAAGAPDATASANCAAIPSRQLSIRVCGNRLVDGQGASVQLRGVNVSGLESVAMFGWSPSNPWGAQTGTPTPDWKLIKSWGSNVVRLPMNEASWLGLSCVDQGGFGSTVSNGVQTKNAPGSTVKADPGGNYRATVTASVAEAAAAGLYVILDLHLAAPGNVCPTIQNAMADADHSIAFWDSVARAFKGSPHVMFELFNEPFLDRTPALADKTPWQDLLNGGGTLTSYIAQVSSAPWQITPAYEWRTAGMQQMLDAVRGTGATNVVLAAPLAYASAIDGWLQYKPNDPIHQLAAVWHAYPAPQHPEQVNCIGLPGCSADAMAGAVAVRAAGFPVVITEFGDAIGGQAPFASMLLPFADRHEIGYLGWTWDTWQGFKENMLITDGAGTPTKGYGTYVKSHFRCRAAGTADCP